MLLYLVSQQQYVYNMEQELAVVKKIYSFNATSLLYTAHSYFVNYFHRYGIPKQFHPNWMNVVREPIERQISRIYYYIKENNVTTRHFHLESCFKKKKPVSQYLVFFSDRQLDFFHRCATFHRIKLKFASLLATMDLARQGLD